jgi:hypothetical protein
VTFELLELDEKAKLKRILKVGEVLVLKLVRTALGVREFAHQLTVSMPALS